MQHAACRVHLRTSGWVQELFVNFTGQTVKKGEPLLAIYSQDFLLAQEEYLIARESDALQQRSRGRPTAAIARQKLRLLG